MARYLIVSLSLIALPAAAEDKLHLIESEPGVFAIEQTGGVAISHKANDFRNFQNYTGSIEYGVTPWWTTEIEGEYIADEPGKNLQFESIDSENVFRFYGCGGLHADPDQDGIADCDNPLTIGGILELEHNPSKYAADDVRFGGIAMYDIGQFSLALNYVLEKQFGVAHDNDWEGVTYAQALYNWKPWLNPGLSYAGDVETIERPGQLKQQRHQIGPVASGYVWGLSYRVEYLIGLTGETESGRFSWWLEREF